MAWRFKHSLAVCVKFVGMGSVVVLLHHLHCAKDVLRNKAYANIVNFPQTQNLLFWEKMG
ncbi:MAG TPA: hypothetical protein VEA59_03685 [Patescibacteria group bacterium]|nr:hypothetical protein [Patescibacteria group bacterium]